MKGPGDLYDMNGIPIHPGDLLRTFHFTGPRRKRFFLYHVAVMTDRGMRMIPTRRLDPGVAKRDRGGDTLMDDDLAAQAEVIDGRIVGDAVLFTERPKRK